ncbi:lethal (2) k09913 [Carabus blaptoides fortunei]
MCTPLVYNHARLWYKDVNLTLLQSEMTTVRIVCTLSNRRLVAPLFNGKYISSHQFTNSNVASLYIISRKISSFEISKNLEIISNEKINTKVSNFKLTACPEKPLVVCLTWLLAKRKTVLKYASMYLDHGFDVLNVTVSPWQVLWPVKGIQLVAKDVLEFLSSNQNYSPLVIHGFSVGAYLWGEVLVTVAQEKERYMNVVDRICGQIWDSSVDVTEIQLGVPPSVFPRNKVMQSALQQYIIYHLKTFDKVATVHYVRASQMFHTNFVKAPALFFVSKADPIGTVSASTRARESWESLGIPVYWKCFEKSPHVGHFRYYPDDYKSEVNALLYKLSLTARDKKIQVTV